MGMNDKYLIDKIDLTFIALTTMARHHCLSAWETDKFMVLPQFGPEGKSLSIRDNRTINHVVHTTCTDVFSHCDVAV